VSTFDGSQDRLYYSVAANAGMQAYLDQRIKQHDPRLKHLPDVRRALHDKVVCLTVIAATGDLRMLEQTLQRRFAGMIATTVMPDIYMPGWAWLTVRTANGDKGRAVRTLQDAWRLAGHELVVFGDNHNDLELFDAADRAIAVDNAVPALKERATQVIGPNSDDSVVRFMNDEWMK
jgi:hypothetical protein